MESIITAAMSTILAPLMGLLIWQLQRVITARGNDSNGIKILLRATLKEYHEKYMNQHYVTADELAEFREMYEAYHKLGGNGRGTVWMDDVDKLERRE